MESHLEIVRTFVKEFSKALRGCPIVSRSFYDSFEFTRTGSNYSHARTIGLLVRACYSLSGIVAVDVDVHLNMGKGIKFQPDMVALDREQRHVLIVDFESPNSSDARIPRKDVEPYVKWIDFIKSEVPYLIITSLPGRVNPLRPSRQRRGVVLPRPKEKWELRYTSPGGCNYEHREFADQIRSSPFTYWYRVYREELEKLSKQYLRLRELPLYFANLDGLELHLIDVWKLRAA